LAQVNGYQVIITRADTGEWEIDVPAVAGAHTYGRTLSAALRSAREVIALMDDVPDEEMDDIVLHAKIEVADDLLVDAASVGEARRVLRVEEARVQSRTAEVARALVARGYSVRDVAALTGVTPGRVSQLAGSGT
jgi:predicted RNase H-like HicB family nuclease